MTGYRYGAPMPPERPMSVKEVKAARRFLHDLIESASQIEEEQDDVTTDKYDQAREEYWEKRTCRTCLFFGPQPIPGPHEYRAASHERGTCRSTKPPWEEIGADDGCGDWYPAVPGET